MSKDYNLLRDQVLCFLANCKVEYDPDADYNSDGTITDLTTWHITVKPFEMDELACALGIKPNWFEDPWVAICRAMKDESEFEERMIAQQIDEMEKHDAADHDS